MASLFTTKSISNTSFVTLFLILTIAFPSFISSQSSLCRTSCGDIAIEYPFSIDAGCGSPYFRHIFSCSDSGKLELRTPSGRYPVVNISYSDSHILVSDPFMWTCNDGHSFRPTRPFSLDTSTHLTLSTQNNYLFFNCSEEKVIVSPKPSFCERFPDKCDSSCDSASYLCRHLPDCPFGLGGRIPCCSYYPKATESLRLMLQYCTSYTSIYWRDVGAIQPYDQVPEYGIRLNYDIPITTSCLQCQDYSKGGGTCGFDTGSQSFTCLCEKGNVTTYCTDNQDSQHHRSIKVIAGTATGLSFAGAIGIGAGIWYIKKLRATAPVMCGVQSNENRIF
ncbi:hypothetical protein MKW94_022814 [Papaver nudicaule]|uniref:Wall-associated receptor kinase galacturonan-binding domain-containing protein n=1 Tax=Papaver nudicaule TaxID=74823 RepID=A0AA42AYS2_PAPNU|nr:hypothetical protein [Papaver nudicaule]